MAREEARTLLARRDTGLVGSSKESMANESANTVLDKPIQLSTHKITSKPTGESAIIDSAATSSCCPSRAKLARTGRPSNKRFEVPTGQVAAAEEERRLPHNLRAPANICHEVPEME